MKTFYPLIVLLSVLVLASCSRLPYKDPLNVNVVTPGECEILDVENVLILADSSGSMVRNEKFSDQRALLQSFIAAMPNNGYEAGMVAFGQRRSWVEVSMQPFDRGLLQEGAAKLPFKGGLTPLPRALRTAKEHLSGYGGKTQVILFTDGLATSPDWALRAAKELALTNSQLYFHAVQLGDEANGTQLLNDIVQLTPGGTFRSTQSINSAGSLQAFVRELFIVETDCPEEEVVEPPEPKDSDGDGVIDELDECPNTPRGAKVDERGCWTLSNVLFDYDKATIRPAFQPLLDDVAVVLQQNPDLRIRIDGHTDSRGSEAYNQALSERRAQAVKDYLVKRGINANRLTVKGFGETQPIAPNTNEENMQENRRVELTVMQ